MSHKKIYIKPAVEIEKFYMDLEIATDDFNMAEIWKDMFFQANNREPVSESEFQEWLLAQPGYNDNGTSGICYFTAANIS